MPESIPPQLVTSPSESRAGRYPNQTLESPPTSVWPSPSRKYTERNSRPPFTGKQSLGLAPGTWAPCLTHHPVPSRHVLTRILGSRALRASLLPHCKSYLLG